MFSYSQSICRPGTSLPTLYYLSNVYALKLLVPTSTNTKKLIISHWCYFQFELILPHGTMVLKCTPKRRNAVVFISTLKALEPPVTKVTDDAAHGDGGLVPKPGRLVRRDGVQARAEV